MICGIYGIKNKVNNKIYIGQSINIQSRWKTHLRELNNKKHANKKLTNSFEKYGENQFEFIMLEVCSKEDAPWKEQEWIDKYSREELFNEVFDVQFRSGDSNPFYGRKHSDECKSKMSELRKGKNLGKDNPNFGKKHGKDIGLKMTLNNHTTKLNVEKVLEIVELLKNGDLSDKTIAEKYNVARTVITRISTGERWANVTGGRILSERRGKRNIGKPLTKEHRAKIGNAITGIKRSEETKRKISESQRR